MGCVAGVLCAKNLDFKADQISLWTLAIHFGWGQLYRLVFIIYQMNNFTILLLTTVWICVFHFQILGCYDLIDKTENRNFTLATQNNIIGGFSKWTNTDVEPLHTYFGKFIRQVYFALISCSKSLKICQLIHFLSSCCSACWAESIERTWCPKYPSRIKFKPSNCRTSSQIAWTMEVQLGVPYLC